MGLYGVKKASCSNMSVCMHIYDKRGEADFSNG